MEEIIIAGLIVVAFVGGVLCGKYVISEAASIKAHVSAEIAKVRVDVESALSAAAKKV